MFVISGIYLQLSQGKQPKKMYPATFQAFEKLTLLQNKDSTSRALATYMALSLQRAACFAYKSCLTVWQKGSPGIIDTGNRARRAEADRGKKKKKRKLEKFTLDITLLVRNTL